MARPDETALAADDYSLPPACAAAQWLAHQNFLRHQISQYGQPPAGGYKAHDKRLGMRAESVEPSLGLRFHPQN